MNSLRKTFNYGLIVLGSLFGMAVSASEFTDNQKLAEQGNVEALVYMGAAYAYGVGVMLDSDESEKAYRKACDKGSRHGCLSIMSELDYLKKLADEGSMKDQHRLGFMYYKGEGVDRNYEKAFTYLLKAAKQGNGDAQSAIAEMYFDGQGIQRDEEEALFWSNKACSNGDETACANYKMLKASLSRSNDSASRSRSNEPAPRIYQNTAPKSQRFVPIQIPQRSSYLLPGAP